jgi:phage tail P2-like protein
VALLPWLAWALSVDEWDTNWSETQKRNAIKTSLSVHMRKGTIGAVREAMAALSFTARVQEWFNQVPPGDPHTFRLLLEADQVGISQTGFGVLLGVIERTKNLRSHLSEIELSVRSVAGPCLVVAAAMGNDFALAGYRPPSTTLNETSICF